MNRPTISMEEMARKNRMPMFRSATPSPGANGMVAKMNMHGSRKTMGARLYTGLSAAVGTTSSFIISFTASAIGCRIPCGPTRYGPMRDCMRAANLRSSRVTYVTMPITALRTMNGAMRSTTQAGRDAIIPRLLSSRASLGMTPGHVEGSSIDLAEDGIDGAHDGHDVRHLVAGHDVRQDREVRERGAAPFHAVRLGAAVGNQVTAHLAARALHAHVRLPLRNARLGHRLEPRPRRDRPLGKAVERLTNDLQRLAELHHPHAVAREAVAGGFHRHGELEVLVGGIGLRAAQVMVDARAAQQRSRDADVFGQLARDDAHALHARHEERVVLEHVLVFADARVDEIHRLAARGSPSRWKIVAHAAHLVEAVEEPRADQR